jgi:hypothetical protein
MSEVVNVLVAFAVIIFLFRWMTNSGVCSTPALREYTLLTIGAFRYTLYFTIGMSLEWNLINRERCSK